MSSSALVAQSTTATTEQKRSLSLSQCLWTALVLWIASNVFVTMIASFATWEGQASYHRMSDLCLWDCGWYSSVLEQGYEKAPHSDIGEVNWPFHPLFPATAYPLRHWLKLSASTSLVLASKIELLVAIFAFLLLLSNETETAADQFRAGSLVAFNPYIIYAHAGYAEPLYFALIALAFYYAMDRRWILSGAAGGLASVTRFVGFIFSTSYAVFWLRDRKEPLSWRTLNLDRAIGLLLCPLGTALFTLYMYDRVGDALVQQHVQVGWQKLPGNPLHTLRLSFASYHWPSVWGAMVIAGLLLSLWLIRLRKPEMAIFLAVSILVPVAATYWSIPRYIWWQPPFLYAVYHVLKRRSGLWAIYIAFASATASFIVVEWFSGHSFIM